LLPFLLRENVSAPSEAASRTGADIENPELCFGKQLGDEGTIPEAAYVSWRGLTGENRPDMRSEAVDP
jgi:hypothetical protein